MERQNETFVTEFFLVGIHGVHDYNILLSCVFLVIYMATIAGNATIFFLIFSSQSLKSPMYFFLSHLSLADICLATNIVPNMLYVIMKKGGTVSFVGCITQLYLFGVFAVTECLLLAVMSYDRFLAISYALHYAGIMNPRLCVHLTSCSWILGFILTMITVGLVWELRFCGPNVIDHFFCDLVPLLALSCSDISSVTYSNFIIAAPVTLFPFVFILMSYVRIFLTILNIPSSTGRQKAFSTCSSHLVVVCIYFGTLIAQYVAPSKSHSEDLKQILSLLYTVVTPLSNPVIYSMRNQEIMKALISCICKNVRYSKTY
ncbi:olfactory receptor 11A1 [Xenopus laevis]|uniref:Olfactory receptor n=2 Tax=Xenopus laevis TaxID=8355 RepID=A0A1L8FBA4_XENLA|nr:olfactory receptor 11A1 [Xenopus laevis]OCT68864.1 hypothetical protein XELAEV_18040169mg [Xenopus laevis]